MSEHDPLCPTPTYGYRCPRCDFIARVRADERERQEDGWAARLNSTVAWAENGVRADLRAKVAALLKAAQDDSDTDVVNNPWYRTAIETRAYQRVLDLFDGGSDD